MYQALRELDFEEFVEPLQAFLASACVSLLSLLSLLRSPGTHGACLFFFARGWGDGWVFCLCCDDAVAPVLA